MEGYFHSVRLDREKCRGCTNCIKPVSYTHLTSHTASIQPMGSLFEQSVVLALDGGIISYLMHERNMDLQAPFVLHANLE